MSTTEKVEEKKPKMNKQLLAFVVVTLFVAVWFGTEMVSNQECNDKVVEIMKSIPVEDEAAVLAQ